jgi:hypothetical protein
VLLAHPAADETKTTTVNVFVIALMHPTASLAPPSAHDL